MRITCTFLLMLCCVQAFAINSYRKLCEVNKCWQQPAFAKTVATADLDMNETEWVRYHLQQTEAALRAAPPAGLSAAQLHNRLAVLDLLHGYAAAGRFPQNEDYSFRTPIFIDHHNTFCAVGYLLQQTGYEAVSRRISAGNNLVYVHDIKDPALNDWANTYGFSINELALIQPGYAPDAHARPVGRGVDSTVYELYGDETDGRVYVGGLFTTADSTVNANNIAYITESNGIYTWHSMDHGFNGPVYAITRHNNNIFAAGSFSMAGSTGVNNVAYWDGNSWNPAGCTYGVIKDLAVFKGELYACGHFDICAALAEVNLARWNGSGWMQIPGITGTINTMEVQGDDLVLGGDFKFNGSQMNVIRWNAANGFQPFGNVIKNIVNDFEYFGDSLYAVCSPATSPDNAYILRLDNGQWNTYKPVSSGKYYSLCAKADTMVVGGDFAWLSMATISGSYNFHRGAMPYADWVAVTGGAVRKVIHFNNKFWYGGDFKQGFGSASFDRLNGITTRDYINPLGINPINAMGAGIRLYPNPLPADRGVLHIDAPVTLAQLRICDAAGKAVWQQQLVTKENRVQLPALAAGVYQAEITDATGKKSSNQLLVK